MNDTLYPCDWCHSLNGAFDADWPWCHCCGHRADLHRQDCDCGFCKATFDGGLLEIADDPYPEPKPELPEGGGP